MKVLGSFQLLLPPCATGGGGGGGGGAFGRDEAPFVGGGGGGGARGRLGGLGAALEGGGGGALLGAPWEGAGVGDGVLRNGGGGRGAREPGGGGGGGAVPRGGLAGEVRAGRRGVDEAGRLIGAGGGLRKDGDVERAVGWRLGTLGGNPEGLKGAERARDGAALLSELLPEYVESRDAKRCQFRLSLPHEGQMEEG